jgi:hypothetical protein
MADIQDRIKKIGNLFKEMQVTQVDGVSVIYVVVSFPDRWIVDDTVKEKYEVSVMEGNAAGEYYFCANIDTGFDRVFDAVDYCIQVNKDAMERAKIFQEKLLKLKELFGNEEITVEELKGLELVLGKRKKPQTKKKTPIEEIADQEIEGNEA